MHVGLFESSRAISGQWNGMESRGKAQEVQERKLSLIQHVMLMMMKNKKKTATLNERRTL